MASATIMWLIFNLSFYLPQAHFLFRASLYYFGPKNLHSSPTSSSVNVAQKKDRQARILLPQAQVETLATFYLNRGDEEEVVGDGTTGRFARSVARLVTQPLSAIIASTKNSIILVRINKKMAQTLRKITILIHSFEEHPTLMWQTRSWLRLRLSSTPNC